jgi:hypothetical protein
VGLSILIPLLLSVKVVEIILPSAVPKTILALLVKSEQQVNLIIPCD